MANRNDSQPMYILVTNDDGIQSAGLLALRQALNDLGDTVVVAPDRNWSAAGRYRKLFDPLRAYPFRLADGSEGIACDGTPADCVALARMGLLERQPDLVVSGINLGANLGDDLLYSGTVAAAMEGLIYGMPGIAVSLYGPTAGEWDFRAAAAAAARLVQFVAERQITGEILFNVNVPTGAPEEIAGWQVTRLGRRFYRDKLLVRHDPRGRPYYWIDGAEPEGQLDAGTDVAAISQRYISVTPVHMDLTSDEWVTMLRDWGLEG